MGQAWKRCPCHWPEHGHVATSNCRKSGKCVVVPPEKRATHSPCYSWALKPFFKAFTVVMLLLSLALESRDKFQKQANFKRCTDEAFSDCTWKVSLVTVPQIYPCVFIWADIFVTQFPHLRKWVAFVFLHQKCVQDIFFGIEPFITHFVPATNVK